MSILWLLFACPSPPHPLPSAMTLEETGVFGVILPHPAVGCQAPGIRVGLWGPTWTTGAPVEAHLSTEEDPRSPASPILWLEFPVQTGLGRTTMALRLQGEEVRLPLGARPGEFELRLSTTPGIPPAAAQEAAAARAAQAVSREVEAWSQGAFLLQDGAQVVGEVRFQGEAGPPMVSVHDLSWLTPAPIAAQRREEGGDLLLQFPVEPSLQGEEGLLRINLLTRAVVVPSGPAPVPEVDRRLGLVPGRLREEERLAAVQRAIEEADDQEVTLLQEQVVALLSATTTQGCRSIEALGEPWTTLMAGYRITLRPRPEGAGRGCEAVAVEPEVTQHRRRFAGILP